MNLEHIQNSRNQPSVSNESSTKRNSEKLININQELLLPIKLLKQSRPPHNCLDLKLKIRRQSPPFAYPQLLQSSVKQYSSLPKIVSQSALERLTRFNTNEDSSNKTNSQYSNNTQSILMEGGGSTNTNQNSKSNATNQSSQNIQNNEINQQLNQINSSGNAKRPSGAAPKKSSQTKQSQEANDKISRLSINSASQKVSTKNLKLNLNKINQNYDKTANLAPLNEGMENQSRDRNIKILAQSSRKSNVSIKLEKQSNGGICQSTASVHNTASNFQSNQAFEASSVGTGNNASVSQGSSSKRNYAYCIDTRQIIGMLEYSIQMLSVPTKSIEEQAERVDLCSKGLTNRDRLSDVFNQPMRSKSSSDSSGGSRKAQKLANERKNIQNRSSQREGLSSSNQNESQDLQNKTKSRVDIFCAGNTDIHMLVKYINEKMRQQMVDRKVQDLEQRSKTGNNSQLINKNSKSDSKIINFARVFGLDEELQGKVQQKKSGDNNLNSPQIMSNNKPQIITHKFAYFVENEKILSKKMFYVDVQRESYVKNLTELKTLLQTFIAKKYKNCITKIGFSSEKELFNIFNKMFNNSKGFFNKVVVRKILYQFWLSIQEIFKQIRYRSNSNLPPSKLSYVDEQSLQNNFYIRLEISARGRQIYEPPTMDSEMDSQTSRISSYGMIYPIHEAIFNSNLRQLSKLLKLEIDGVFYSSKNQLDPCGNTPLMLAVKLGNIDAVKILSDMYTCPKLRPLSDLMNAKEIAVAMKHRPILKILMYSNQKIKQQFFEENKEAIFNVLEQMPDFQVDLDLKCDSNWFPVFSSVAPSDTYKIFKQGSNLRLDMTLLGLQKFNLIKGNISVLYKGRNQGSQSGDLLIIDNKIQTVNSIFSRNIENKINTEIQDIITGKQVLKKYQTQNVQTEIETDRSGKPIVKKINDYACQKYVLKSRYNMIKYQMNLSQIDQIKGFKSFEEYVDVLQIDYVTIIDVSTQQDREQQGDNAIGNFFKQKFGPKEQVALTSRANFGGTSKIDNKGGLSSRDGSQFRNLAEFGGQSIMHTQEDQPNHDSVNAKIFGQPKNSVSTISQINKGITIKKNQQKQINANLWLSKSYPFDIEGFLPLIHVLSFCSKQIRQFNKFLLKYPLPPNSFPVEARIPLFMTMEAVFSFRNIRLGFNDPSVFEIDKEVSIKQSQNMHVYAKQQMSQLNMHSSLDTLEDKQAKALKEIYKLCKTDEGDQSGIIDDDLYRNIGQPKEPGEDSETSDKIKDLFENMLQNEDDQNDLLLIEENDLEDLVSQGGLKRRNRPKKTEKSDNHIQSRNFASDEGSFNDIKKSFTHSELLRMRKGGNLSGFAGKTPSKQFSLNSDITESIEVSEKSFNDKLAKLQIHSFQNVKFMSQLKKVQLTGVQSDDRAAMEGFNLESQLLSGQYELNFDNENLEKDLQIYLQQNEIDREQGQTQNKILIQKKHLSQLEQFQQQSKMSKIQNWRASQEAKQNKKGEKLISQEGWRPNQQLKMVNDYQNQHLKNASILSMQSSVNHENIYDSKINEERPKINKSLGKHQINNNLQMWTKAGVKIYKDPQPNFGNMQMQNQLLGGRPPMVVQQPNFGNGKKSNTFKLQTIRQHNYANNLNNGSFNHSNATIGTVSGSTVKQDFNPRNIPRLKNQVSIPQPNNGNSGISLTGSQMDHGDIMAQSVSSSNNNFVSAENSGMNNGRKEKGPNSTADSSVRGSYQSHAFREEQKQPFYRGPFGDPSKNKRLNLRGLQRERSSIGKTGPNQRGGYLQTIESEGNLPTYFGKGDGRPSHTKGSNNNLSQRSIHSLESLKSEGSQAERDMEPRPEEDEDDKLSDHSSYNNFIHSRINTDMQQKAHHGDNDVDDEGLMSEQVFSYEKQHRTGIKNIDTPTPANEPQPKASTSRKENASSLPVQNRKLHIRIPQQEQPSKLNFFQVFSNFIQESITDRKHHSSKQGVSENDPNVYQIKAQSKDRYSNEDQLFNKNMSNNKSDISKRSGSQTHLSKVAARAGPMTTPSGSNMMSPVSGQNPRQPQHIDGSIESKEQMSGGSAEIPLKYSQSHVVFVSSKDQIKTTQPENSASKGIQMFHPRVFLLDNVQESRDSTLVAGFTDLSPGMVSPQLMINHDEEGHILGKMTAKKDFVPNKNLNCNVLAKDQILTKESSKFRAFEQKTKHNHQTKIDNIINNNLNNVT